MLAVLAASLESVHAADIYVKPSGNDNNTGTLEAPLASLFAAKSAVARFAGKEPVTVHVGDGVYYLPETLVFKATDSGNKENPVIYRAVNEGGAILSGGSSLDLKWEPYKDGIFQAKTPAGLEFDQVFINGEKQHMARYPNYDPAAPMGRGPFRTTVRDVLSPERVEGWADPAGGFAHCWDKSGIGGHHRLITGKDSEGNLEFKFKSNTNTYMGFHPTWNIVENIFEELDVAKEWYHNSKTNTLYYKPDEGVDLNTVTTEVARLQHLVDFQGSEASPVRHITFQGFVVRHSARTFMDTTEPLLRSTWNIHRCGAFMLTGTENVQILDTEFDHVGGNAIFVNHYNRDVLIKGCHIHHTGASAICFVGDPNAVRNPLFDRVVPHDLSKIDRTVGPKTNNYPATSSVEDCLIHDVGQVELQTAGILISMSQQITVRDSSIYDVTTTAINVNDATWGGHLIERCDTFSSGKETISLRGGGRYKQRIRMNTNAGKKQMVLFKAELKKDPSLPFLDAVMTTTLRNNRVSTDINKFPTALTLGGAIKYDIHNNLILSGSVSAGNGFRQHIWNNIIMSEGMAFGEWVDDTKDKIHSNILMLPYSFYSYDAFEKVISKDRIDVDRNLFNFDKLKPIEYRIKTNAKVYLVKKEELGFDENSVHGDPMFVDPANGDFRVKEDSPAFKVGFKNFPMDQFGVKKPSLRAIAETPKMPTSNANLQNN